jgi:Ca2+-binding EF-hand superfamily protein
LEQACDIRQVRDEDKMIEPADLRYVLKQFGFSYTNQSLFIDQIAKNQPVHLEDLISRMKSTVKSTYGMATYANKADNIQAMTMEELRSTDFFDKIQTKIRTAAGGIDSHLLYKKLKAFDPSDSGKVQVYHLINVLRHNMSFIFDDELLIGLQFELETLDHTVDYSQFMKLFIEGKT